MRSHRLKELRSAAKLSLNKLHELTGVPKSTLGEAELYKTKLSPQQVKKLCEFFEITENEFYK
jgi:transcriptional regulator with XRE-family HTH domain